MLSAQDISSERFDKHMGRGYKQEQVDSFLQMVASDFLKLQQDNADLEKKLIVLAEKLEEYKQDEESLRSALIGAQKLGDSVIRDAKSKAATILEDANIKAAGMLETARRTITREQQAFLRTRREIATFKSKLMLLYKQHLELIELLPVEDGQVHHEAPPVQAAPVQQEVPAVPLESAAVLPAELELPVDEVSMESEPLAVEAPEETPVFSNTDEISFDAINELESNLEEPAAAEAVSSRIPQPKERPTQTTAARSGRTELKFGSDYNLWGKKK